MDKGKNKPLNKQQFHRQQRGNGKEEDNFYIYMCVCKSSRQRPTDTPLNIRKPSLAFTVYLMAS